MKTKLWVALAAPACLLALTACKATSTTGATSGVCDYAPSRKPSAKIGLTASQKNHAETIVLKGAEMGMPLKGVEVAVTAALQESRLDNGATGDDGSAFGLFQMRPVINGRKTSWGSYSQVTNPDYAAGKFYRVLKGVDGWRFMSHAAAAQAVEKSANGALYRDNVGEAQKIVKRIAWEQCKKIKPA